MPRFARAASWINKIFPASGRPYPDISILTPDVQLVHDYGGSGIAWQGSDASAWFSRQTVTKAGDNSFVLFSPMPVDETTRLLHATVACQPAGGNMVVALNQCRLVCRATSTSTSYVALDAAQTQWLNVADVPAKPGIIGLSQPCVLPPFPAQIEVFFGVGDNRPYTFTFLFLNAPIGAGYGF